MKRKLTVLTVLVLLLGFGMVGSAFAGKLQMQLSQESTLEQIMKRGVMRVGMDTFVPWAMKSLKGPERKVCLSMLMRFFLGAV